MSKPFDYSKWDKIELSDDEEDVHPNIDRESWFRMKHRSRVEREENEEKDKQRIVNEVSCENFVCSAAAVCFSLCSRLRVVERVCTIFPRLTHTANLMVLDGQSCATYQDFRTRFEED